MADGEQSGAGCFARAAEQRTYPRARGSARRAARWWASALVVAGGQWLGVGCGGTVVGKTPARSEVHAPPSVRRLLPLEHDTVFSYEITSDAGDQGLLIQQVRRPREGLVELDVAGRVQRLDVEDDRVMHASGGYLLKEPIAPGETFRGAFGEVRVTELDKSIEVPAGAFRGCVETVEESAIPFKRATSVYCPGVGLVFLVVEARSEGGDVLRIESRLKTYGPRVTL